VPVASMMVVQHTQTLVITFSLCGSSVQTTTMCLCVYIYVCACVCVCVCVVVLRRR
jgi:hypothetical protein